MGLANSLTLPAVMLLYGAFRSKSIVDLLLAGTTAFVIFMLGSRGALLGIMVFFLLLLAVGCKRKDRRSISILFIALICLGLVFWKPVLTWVNGALNRMGSSSRTLQLLLDGNILEPSRRIILYKQMGTELIAHPLAVRGVGGELPFITSVYAHNFVFELLMDFGIALGGIAVLYILFQCGRTVWEAVRQDDVFSMTKLIFFSVSVPLALVSGTIWAEVYLWCWLALCDKRYPVQACLPVRRDQNDKLLSIVVPTRNSYAHLFSLIELCAAFPNRDFELVVQDNSDDNREMLDLLSKGAYSFVNYHSDPSPLSASQNSELALQHACGRYVCLLEEDDLLSEKLMDFVAYMEQKSIDSAIFSLAQYIWPGATREGLRFPDLTIRSFDGQMWRINVKRAYRRFLRTGSVRGEHMPRLYRGVVRRAILEQIRDTYGTWFPGSDPDAAISVILARFVKKHVFFNAPLISSGVSSERFAGLGAKDMHKEGPGTPPFLPEDMEIRWDGRIPRVVTEHTIRAQGALDALRASGHKEDVKRFNFAYFLAFFDVFHKELRAVSKACRRQNKVNGLLYGCCRFGILVGKGCQYVSDKLLLTVQWGGMLADSIPNALAAQKRIDEEIAKIPLPFQG